MNEPITALVRGGAWLATYLVHSTVLLCAVLVATRMRDLPDALIDRLWKIAAVGGLFTATLAVAADVRPLMGRVDLPPAVRAVHTVRETRTLRPGDAAPIVHREESVVRPGFPQPAHWAALAFVAFLAVGGAGAAGFLMRRRSFHHSLRDRSPLAEEPGGASLLAWLRQLPGGDAVRVSVTHALPGPAVIGSREICLPRRMFRELRTPEQHGILAHELAHVVRRDPLWLVTLGLLRAFFFIQPLNRIALIRFQRSAEVLCDDWAVLATGRPIALARSIARVAAWVRGTPVAAVPAMAEPGVAFVGRIERLVQRRRPPHARAIAVPALLLPIVLLALAAVPTVRPAAVPAPDEVRGDRRIVRMLVTSDEVVGGRGQLSVP